MIASTARYVAILTTALALVLTVAGCGRTAAAPSADTASASLPATTPPAKGPVKQVTWALYRDINTLDPAFAYDYPENTVVSTMCEALERQQPNGSIEPGLASLHYATPTRIMLTLRPGIHFWDGHPLTPADVVFSLRRQSDPKLGGFYGSVFDRVRSITAVGTHQVQITLSQPDYWLAGELSAMPGVIIEKQYAEAKGHAYGTPGGGVMCTGPFKLKSWRPGAEIDVVANHSYWDPSLRPQVGEIRFEGISDAAALTSGLSTGAVDGTYLTDTSNLADLRHLSEVSVYEGPSFDTDYFIPSNLSGPLGDARVRRALSLAFDRSSYISTVYDGGAQIPHLSVNPGAWGFARDVFQHAWNSAPAPTQNLARARALIKAAGAKGKQIVIGTSTGLATTATEADAWQAAAQSIGLRAKLYNVSPANYIDFFTDPGARRHVDAFTTTTYGDYADPAALDATYVIPGGSQNFDHYSDPQITQLLDKARAEADPRLRARDDVAAERLIMKELPWIPVADPDTFLVMNKRITGAPSSFVYMQAPWLARLGSAR
jgi:peptide/nickel transport system substrate-binding protein